MTTRRWWIVWLLLLAPLAQAATPSTGSGRSPSTGSGQAPHAFLDRSHVSLGDTVTLNLQSSGPLGNPDLSALQKDFEVLGTSRSRSVQIVNGKATRTSQLGIALKPLHAGTLTIPALTVGGGTTQALTLQVGAPPSGGAGKVGDPVFMEADVQPASPRVGQQTVYTVRLFYLPGVDGALGDPSVDGARLIALDRDHRYLTERDGYTYKVIERSWALIPQRSGAIKVQGPVFQGQRLGPGSPNAWFNNPNALLNNPNAWLNGRMPGFGTPVHATAPTARVDVRAPPANAGQPWLPARSVQLQLSGLPANGAVNAGTPLTVTLSISASGQPADALPEPELPPIAGARVYPDQTRDATDDRGQWLRGTRTRSFAIVPERNGTLTIPAITLDWWDVQQNHAEQAKVPAHVLEVSGVGAAGSVPAATAATPANSGGVRVAGTDAKPAMAGTSVTDTHWRGVALASLGLWLLVVVAAGLWWLWSRRRGSSAAAPASVDATRGTGQAAATILAATSDHTAGPPETAVDKKVLQQDALAAARTGDAAECERALLAWARAAHRAIVNLGALRDALADSSQREALAALQRARWQGAAAAPACAAVARAFAAGFVWRGEDRPARAGDNETLPPLYPLP